MDTEYEESLGRPRRNPAAAVSHWNQQYPMGTAVTYLTDHGHEIKTFTRSRAQILSGHSAVVWLDHVSGCVALDRVTPRKQVTAPESPRSRWRKKPPRTKVRSEGLIAMKESD